MTSGYWPQMRRKRRGWPTAVCKAGCQLAAISAAENGSQLMAMAQLAYGGARSPVWRGVSKTSRQQHARNGRRQWHHKSASRIGKHGASAGDNGDSIAQRHRARMRRAHAIAWRHLPHRRRQLGGSQRVNGRRHGALCNNNGMKAGGAGNYKPRRSHYSYGGSIK